MISNCGNCVIDSSDRGRRSQFSPVLLGVLDSALAFLVSYMQVLKINDDNRIKVSKMCG